MKIPAMIFIWTGESMLPTLHYTRLAESSFTSGQAYKMIVGEEKEKVRRRSLEQNSQMWALLQEISEQVEHCGRHFSPDQWKVLLMHALGNEVQFLPALDNKTFVPYGGRSSHMSVGQMSELIEFIRSWGSQRGVRFSTEQGVTW